MTKKQVRYLSPALKIGKDILCAFTFDLISSWKQDPALLIPASLDPG